MISYYTSLYYMICFSSSLADCRITVRLKIHGLSNVKAGLFVNAFSNISMVRWIVLFYVISSHMILVYMV